MQISQGIFQGILRSMKHSFFNVRFIRSGIITGKLSVEEGAQVDATISMKSSKKLKALDTEQNNSSQSEKQPNPY